MPETIIQWAMFAFYTGGAGCGWWLLAVWLSERAALRRPMQRRKRT